MEQLTGDQLLHREIELAPGALLSVRLSDKARIRLIDAKNYSRFRNGERYRYVGRSSPRSEVTLKPESDGQSNWHLVILPEDPDMMLSATVDIH